MESQGFSVYSGMTGFSPLLDERENKPSKKYVIFDQSGNSMRILVPPHLPETKSFHETLALGVAAFENAKAARASSVLLSPADLGRWENGSHNIDSVCDNINSYQTEGSEELDALLNSSDDEDEDEVTSTVTFADSEEFCSGVSDEVDQSKKRRQVGICKGNEDDAGIEEFNLEKRRLSSPLSKKQEFAVMVMKTEKSQMLNGVNLERTESSTS